MTSYEPIPAAPPTLGEALAFPGIYLEPPAGLLAAVPARRVRRPGRVRRRMATIAAVVAAASLAGCAAAYRVPAPAGTPWLPTQAARALQAVAAAGCHTPTAPSGTTISVDQAGNATAPYTGGLGYRCDGGTWVRIPAPAAAPAPVPAQPQRPVWDGKGTYPNDGIEPLCPAADAGHHAVAGKGANRFAVVCAWDGSEFAWGVR